MEASDTAGQPAQEPGQTDATGQEQNEQSQADSSQEQSQQDSQLTTPQPDQPAPSEAERQPTDDSQVSQPDTVGGSTVSPGPSGEPAEGTVSPPQFPTNVDQESAAVDRERDLEEDRRAHNARTGGGEIQPNEVQDTRQKHNDRTGGGQIPGTSEPVQESEPEEQPES